MNQDAESLTPEQVAEIEKHKYFLSEKAGHDVGWEFAQQDWLENFASDSASAGQNGEDEAVAGGIGAAIKRLFTRSKAASF